ncbi:hypothetical protein VT84_21160 [Gemmata sp. SH-PL17]|uniref:hypothetical protein n=1 Tax=Gemmata sp. SH-PL17 TaxID=1630693 RepID=UPI00078CCF6A|nr:hypothetical protein [Gemmata sp. SH-PL17]AMV26924.1 hypothetical protein VT84_21160 [Gemmata sp. SH-PL17]
MIFGIEVGLAIFGILALVRGRMTMSKGKVVVGVPARLLGLVALTPLPVALVVILLYTIAQGGADPEKFAQDQRLTIALIEAGVVISIAVFVFVVGAMIGVSPVEVARRERKGRYEEDEYDDRGDYDDRERTRDRDNRDEDGDWERKSKNR